MPWRLDSKLESNLTEDTVKLPRTTTTEEYRLGLARDSYSLE